MENNLSTAAKIDAIPLENANNMRQSTNLSLSNLNQSTTQQQNSPLQTVPLESNNQTTKQQDQQVISQESTIPKQLSPIIAQQHKRIFKIIVIGDSNVGKTCLTFRFCGGKFLQRSEATIGVDL
jgi:hypothetical protein